MWSRQGDLYSLIEKQKKDGGKIPEETCPRIDKILEFYDLIQNENQEEFSDLLEGLRKDNAKLRELGIDWYNFCGALSDKADEIIKDIEEERDEFEQEKKDLESTVEDLKDELSRSNPQ